MKSLTVMSENREGVALKGKEKEAAAQKRVPLADKTNTKEDHVEVEKSRLVAALTSCKISDPRSSKEEEEDDKSSEDSKASLDIDEEDRQDPQSVTDYVLDIYDHLLWKETQCLLSETFAPLQTEITEKMRTILVDWLVEVHRMFKLLPETLFLTVYMTDKYLRKVDIKKDELQLVGISSMFIASKYEEIYAPECNDFVYISDGAYSKKKILEMECALLNTLGFNLTVPVSLLFLRRFSKAAGSDYIVHNLCKFIIETMLLDPKIHSYPPSLVAAASVYISRKMTHNSELWTPILEHHSTYSEEKVRQFAVYVNDKVKAFKKTGNYKAIEKKYSTDKFGNVACIPLTDI